MDIQDNKKPTVLRALIECVIIAAIVGTLASFFITGAIISFNTLFGNPTDIKSVVFPTWCFCTLMSLAISLASTSYEMEWIR